MKPICRLDDGALRAAARLAGADTVVDRLPHGYATMLSRVVEQGTHDRPLAAGGESARLHRQQAHGFARPADAVAG